MAKTVPERTNRVQITIRGVVPKSHFSLGLFTYKVAFYLSKITALINAHFFVLGSLFYLKVKVLVARLTRISFEKNTPS